MHDETGVGDGLVLRPHHFGDGVDELLLRLVVLVEEPVVDGARSEGGDKSLHVVHSLQRRLEVGDVRVDEVVADVGEGPGADLHLARLVFTANQSQAKALFLGVELPEVRAVAAVQAHRGHLARGGHLHLEATDALVQIEVEAGLGLLALTDDVYAKLDLLVDYFLDRLPYFLGQFVRIIRLASALCVQQWL